MPYNKALTRAQTAIDAMLKYTGTDIPHVSEGYSYQKGFYDKVLWTAGFWPGMLWLMYKYTGKSQYADKARETGQVLAEFLARTGPHSGHDLGFQFFLSAKAEYDYTGNEQAKALGIQAAEALAQRYVENGGYIRAWGALDTDEQEGIIIVDCLLNLPLLFWASTVTKSKRYYNIAFNHALISLQHLMREDGTVYHTFKFDPQTGQPVAPGTHQGHATDSTWARGQAWAIYGFALAYKHTRDERFLQASKRAVEAYYRLLNEDEVIPPWDFDRPQGTKTVKDTSAASITASGLLELAAFVEDQEKAELKERARVILTELENHYACDPSLGQEGLLTEGCYHYPANKGAQECTSWGDYFYLEAMLKDQEGISIY